MNSTLEDIVRSGLCHGCGGCAASLPTGRIKLQMNEAGFLRPQACVPLSRTDHDSVIAVCSGNSMEHSRGLTFDPIWGPLVAVRTGYAADAAVRFAGSSGGVISALLIHLLETGVVDSIWHTVADPADPFGNTVQRSKTRREILAAAGSRYAPSSPLTHLERCLEREGRFAFVGKPCDVATLRRMGERDRRIGEKIPVMISFMCAGIPSRNAVLRIPEAMGASAQDVTAFAFRGEGWPGYARALLRDGRKLQMGYNESWGKILSRHLQFRCKICPDGTGEFADIVCADAWFGKDGYPDFEERPGRSLILTRSPTGEKLLQSALGCEAVMSEACAKDAIKGMQPYQYDRKRSVLARIAALMVTGREHPRFVRMGLWRAALRGSPLLLARNFAGTLRRLFQNKVDFR